MHKPDHIFDSLLINAYQSGNKKAFNLLVKRWNPTFCKHALWYVKQEAIAQDIAQECWIVILSKIHMLKDANKFAPWALQIVHRRAIDHFRKEQKKPVIRQEKAFNEAINSSQAVKTASEQKEQSLVLMQKAIQQLPVKQRIVIELFYKNELNLTQIAQVLSVSKGTIKSRLFYARESLKQQLKQNNYGNE